jgi:hypothetical protein
MLPDDFNRLERREIWEWHKIFGVGRIRRWIGMSGRRRPNRAMTSLASLLLAGAASLVLSCPADALTVNPTFDALVTQPARDAFNFAAAEFQALYTDPINVNITVNTNTTGLGGSSTPVFGVFSYAQVRTNLINDNTAHPSADGNTSVGPGGSINTAIDPSTTGRYFIPRAEGKALGIIPNDLTTDGTFTYNRNLIYAFNPNNRMVAGAFDFIGVAEHEISEIMGRIPGLGANIGGSAAFLPYDLFRYTGANTRGVTHTGAGNFFSINNGTTNLHGFNDADTFGGDAQDWDASNPSDPYNAFTGTNQGHAITSYDITTLDVIGYDLRQAVQIPEPGTLALFGTSLLGLAVLRRLRRRRT